MYNDNDLKNLNEIKTFLDDSQLSYSTEYDNFCVSLQDKTYEIEYVPSYQFPIAYPKYNIKGVPLDYFFKLSKHAEDNNSFKLWIKDFEWENPRKREVLKSYILYATGKITNRIYARDCVVKVVQPKECRAFEDEHCFYGRRGASLSLGLYTKKDGIVPKDTLVMIYTFGKNFFGKDDSIEIIRVGTIKRHQVIGGASKLLKHFINNYPTITIGKNSIPVKKLKFYSDYDHNIGSSMDTLGFKFVGYSGGGFVNYWVETGEIKARDPMNHKWVMEQMKLGKVLAIPNAGTKTFIYEILI